MRLRRVTSRAQSEQETALLCLIKAATTGAASVEVPLTDREDALLELLNSLERSESVRAELQEKQALLSAAEFDSYVLSMAIGPEPDPEPEPEPEPEPDRSATTAPVRRDVAVVQDGEQAPARRANTPKNKVHPAPPRRLPPLGQDDEPDDQTRQAEATS